MTEEELIDCLKVCVVDAHDVRRTYPHKTLKGAIRRLESVSGLELHAFRSRPGPTWFSFDAEILKALCNEERAKRLREDHPDLLELLKRPRIGAELRRLRGEAGARVADLMAETGLIRKTPLNRYQGATSRDQHLYAYEET